MKNKINTTCPECQGKKVIEGACECSSEWRGNHGENGWSDCQCAPEQQCLTCHGTGIVQSDK